MMLSSKVRTSTKDVLGKKITKWIQENRNRFNGKVLVHPLLIERSMAELDTE